MITVAIVEDNSDEAQRLESLLLKAAGEFNEEFNISFYNDALAFLYGYKGFDLVFMDIEMPYMNGLDGAKKLRQIDSETVLIFVTNMAQYAIKGYEVNALDFIVKPVAESDFKFKLRRAITSINNKKHKELIISSNKGIHRISVNDLLYVEVQGHNLTYWLDGGNQISVRGKISDTEKELKKFGFMRCHNSFLVNPMHITSVEDYTVKIKQNTLPISHPKKKAFLRDLAAWYGKGGA